MRDPNDIFAPPEYKNFEVKEDHKIRDVISPYTERDVQAIYDMIKEAIAKIVEETTICMAALQEAAEVIQKGITEPGYVDILIMDDPPPERPRTYPIKKSKRPPASWAAKQSKAIRRTRPQARSTIRQRGDRRRP